MLFFVQFLGLTLDQLLVLVNLLLRVHQVLLQLLIQASVSVESILEVLVLLTSYIKLLLFLGELDVELVKHISHFFQLMRQHLLSVNSHNAIV